MNNLQDFMISKVRVKMIELFYTSQNEMYYVREITRAIKEEINAVRRELDRMLEAGILKSEQRGNRLYYSLNPKYLFFQELQQMVAKSAGLGDKIRKARRKLGTVTFVMFSARFIKGLAPRQSELDLLVIGDIVLPELEQLVKFEEKRLEREINYAVFSDEEFEFRKTRRDPFIMDVLYGSRVMVIGSEEEFVEKNLPGL
jgi:DNA-binding transcriptional ArsR family regulator